VATKAECSMSTACCCTAYCFAAMWCAVHHDFGLIWNDGHSVRLAVIYGSRSNKRRLASPC
jgi:hypothetical protein